MNDNNEERREDRNRKMSLEEDKSILEERIELLSWTLENMKNSDIYICALIETKMNEIIDIINPTDSVLEADPLHSELRILDWIFYQVCVNQK
jgi:hypothetical protein